MPLVFSPLSEEILDPAPRSLYPRSVFMMRQLGEPPDIDEQMAAVAKDVFDIAGIPVLDAGSSIGGKDFLERILGLIRGVGFVVAVFSDATRRTALANISLELGFAAMCGKPLIIIKSKGAEAPSDLTRTDYIEYDPNELREFTDKLGIAIDEIGALADFERAKLEVALEAEQMDCGIAFERARKAFLLTGEAKYVEHAQTILMRLNAARESREVDDLGREREEIRLFVKQAEAQH